MRGLKYPTQQDINEYYSSCILCQTNDRIISLLPQKTSSRLFGFKNLKKDIDYNEFLWQLHHRLIDTTKSYSLLSYFFNKGIPDEEWYASPGASGASIEYFPHFQQDVQYEIKDWFDYYSDVFYYKFFSALDMVGHILNIKFELGIKSKVSFQKALSVLQDKDPALRTKIKKIINCTVYSEARRLRNDSAHNYSPSSTGMSVNISEKGGSMGIRDYTPSAVVMDNIPKAMTLLDRIITISITWG